jgi:3-oxoadipate enol-lactonase
MGAKEVMTEPAGGSRPRSYERGGVTLGFSVVGDGQPILFVHGTTATGEFEWGRLAAGLPSEYQCVLPDLRGHGRSELGDSSEMGQAICADLRHLIEHLSLDQPHIVGFSYGSEIALMLELSAPGTAKSLVMVSPGTGRPNDYKAPRLEHLYRTWPFALRRLHETHHGPEHWRQLVTVMHVDSVNRSEFSRETLGGVGCPVLLVAGTNDVSTRRAQGKRFADVNPLARYVELDGAGHAVHHKCRDKFAEVMSAFLTEVDSERAGSHAAAEGS